MKWWLVFLMFIPGFILPVKSQDKKADSLLNVLKRARQDTAKVNTCYALSIHYAATDPDTAVFYAKKGLALSLALGNRNSAGNGYLAIGSARANQGEYDQAQVSFNKALVEYNLALKSIGKDINAKQLVLKQQAKTYNNLGVLFDSQGNYPEALKNYNVSLKIRFQIHDATGIGDSYNNIGNVYMSQGNYAAALRYCTASLNIREAVKDLKAIGNSYHNIGNIYLYQLNYSEALKNYQEALKIRKAAGNKKGTGRSYNSIGLIYYSRGDYYKALENYLEAFKIFTEINDDEGLSKTYGYIGDVHEKQENYNAALKNYTSALEIAENAGDYQGVALAHLNIGVTYDNQGRRVEALKNVNRSLEISEEMGDKQNTTFCNNYLGVIYTRLGNYNLASGHFNKSLAMAREIGSLMDLRDIYRNLVTLDSARNDYKKALTDHKQFVIYRDSLSNEENTKKIVQMQLQYEYDKKAVAALAEQKRRDENQLQELRKQKLLRNSFLIGFIIVLSFAGIVYNQRNRIRSGKKRSDELLLNILPSEVAEELKTNGSAAAKQFENVTVMFTDFKDFTRISEMLSPAELVEEINICYRAFDQIMEKYTIEKIKTIGDSYMAAGGLPVENKTNASDVVNAAIEICNFMRMHSDSRKESGKDVFDIRIGIHTGPVVAGIVGIKKFAYDIWGDTVNIASRMESSGEAGKINISAATFQFVKDKFHCIHRGKIVAKNKGEIDMYFVEQGIKNV